MFMKTYSLKLVAIMVATTMIFSCTEQENLTPEDAEILFRIDGVSRELSPDDVTILLTLETNEGEDVTDHELTLRLIDGAYISDHVDLEPGDYIITELMVVNENADVLYATPLKNSKLGHGIERALPYKFSWNRNTSLNIALPVMNVEKRKPNMFGYRSFKVKANPFKVEVLIPGANGPKRTSAQAIVLNGMDTLKRFRLYPKMNNLVFKGDPSQTYTLTIVKNNYSRYSEEVRFKDLKHNPVQAELDPALTLVVMPTGDDHYYGMEFDAWGYFDFNVNWGDGTTEIWSSGITTELNHHYENAGKYFITISGSAVDSIIWVGNYYNRVKHISMDHLINLFDFRMENAEGPKNIKLPNSRNLSDVRINRSGTETIKIPDNGSIYLIELVGNVSLRPESFNEIIRDVHHQVTNRPRAGEILYFIDDTNLSPIVQPSAEAIQMLRELKHTYGWFLVPDPDLL